MTYSVAAALQEAVYARLTADDALRQMIGSAIYDAVPPGTPPGTFVVLGPEEVVDRSDSSTAAAEHRLRISVISAKGPSADSRNTSPISAGVPARSAARTSAVAKTLSAIIASAKGTRNRSQ